MQHRHRAFPINRVVARTNCILPRHFLRIGDDIAQRLSRDGLLIQIDQIAKFLHQLRYTACVVEMLHVMRAGRLEIDQDRNLAAELVESLEIDTVFCPIGDRSEMNQPIGRAADRLKHHLRITERSRCQQITRTRPPAQSHFGGALAAMLRRAHALGMRRRDGCAHRQ